MLLLPAALAGAIFFEVLAPIGSIDGPCYPCPFVRLRRRTPRPLARSILPFPGVPSRSGRRHSEIREHPVSMRQNLRPQHPTTKTSVLSTVRLHVGLADGAGVAEVFGILDASGQASGDPL